MEETALKLLRLIPKGEHKSLAEAIGVGYQQFYNVMRNGPSGARISPELLRKYCHATLRYLERHYKTSSTALEEIKLTMRRPS